MTVQSKLNPLPEFPWPADNDDLIVLRHYALCSYGRMAWAVYWATEGQPDTVTAPSELWIIDGKKLEARHVDLERALYAAQPDLEPSKSLRKRVHKMLWEELRGRGHYGPFPNVEALMLAAAVIYNTSLPPT